MLQPFLPRNPDLGVFDGPTRSRCHLPSCVPANMSHMSLLSFVRPAEKERAEVAGRGTEAQAQAEGVGTGQSTEVGFWHLGERTLHAQKFCAEDHTMVKTKNLK